MAARYSRQWCRNLRRTGGGVGFLRARI